MRLKLDENLGARGAEMFRLAGHDLFAAMQTLISGLSTDDIEGRLWIVQRGRIREYQPEG